MSIEIAGCQASAGRGYRERSLGRINAKLRRSGLPLSSVQNETCYPTNPDTAQSTKVRLTNWTTNVPGVRTSLVSTAYTVVSACIYKSAQNILTHKSF